MTSLRRALMAMGALALALVPPLDEAWSQTARTVKFVVPFPAGGGAALKRAPSLSRMVDGQRAFATNSAQAVAH